MNFAFGITMLLFALLGFISIIGVLWAQYNKKPKKIWIMSILINAFLLAGSVALYNHLLTPEEKNIISAQREQQKIEQSVKNVQNNQDVMRETASAESIITSIASKNLGDNFKKIEVKDFIDDSTKKLVLVHYNGNIGYDNAMTKKSMLIQTAELFKELFAAGIPIQEVTAFIYADVKGSSVSHEGLVMKCQLKGSNASNIDWRNINKTKFDQNLDNIWIAPALKK